MSAHAAHEGDCGEGCFAAGPWEASVLRRTGAQTLNDAGEWVPSIPLPLYGYRKQCSCKRRFWTMRGYRGHYALAHILKTP